jgi:2-C-methyl-D-erythritol 4-phosphate cytidylyltransferase
LKNAVIIVAAGLGARMQSAIPKQFLKLNGKPVLLHSIEAFIRFDPNITIALILPADQFGQWEAVVHQFGFTSPVSIAAGGETRFESVRNGLTVLSEQTELVAVHDAVRPLVAQETIARAYKSAAHYGTGVPAIPLNDSIRQIESSQSVAVDRSRFCLIQTPQCFERQLLQRAYKQEYKYTFTDDASVVEALGKQIHLVDGNVDNFKLTTPTDLVIAEALLKNRESGIK